MKREKLSQQKSIELTHNKLGAIFMLSWIIIFLQSLTIFFITRG